MGVEIGGMNVFNKKHPVSSKNHSKQGTFYQKQLLFDKNYFFFTKTGACINRLLAIGQLLQFLRFPIQQVYIELLLRVIEHLDSKPLPVRAPVMPARVQVIFIYHPTLTALRRYTVQSVLSLP